MAALVIVGLGLLVFPSAQSSSDAWTPDEYLSVHLNEPFVVPGPARFNVLDGTNTTALIELEAFTRRGPTILSNRHIELRRTADLGVDEAFRFEVNRSGPPTASFPILGDFGSYKQEELQFQLSPFLIPEDMMEGLVLDEIVFDIQKREGRVGRYRTELAVLGVLSLIGAAAVHVVARGRASTHRKTESCM